MLDFAYGFLFRAAVMVPVMVLVSALIWLSLKRLGKLRLDEPFDASRMRTWPLSYIAAESAIFALCFAAIAALISALYGENDFVIAIAAGVSAMVALRIAPAIAGRFTK